MALFTSKKFMLITVLALFQPVLPENAGDYFDVPSGSDEPNLTVGEARDSIREANSQSELNADDASQSEPGTEDGSQLESGAEDVNQSEHRAEDTVQSDRVSESPQSQPEPQPSARPKRRFNCTIANRTAEAAAAVQLINSSDFSELRSAVAPPAPMTDPSLSASSFSNQSECAVLLYYLPYCPYSVSLAPHYNALARAFPGLHFFAVDADNVSPFYANYTISVAPYIRLFRDRDFIGMNTTLRTLESLTAELANLTGHTPAPNVTVTEADWIGPVSSVLMEPTDYWLMLSCLYFALLAAYVAATKWPPALAAWTRLRHRLLARRAHAD